MNKIEKILLVEISHNERKNIKPLHLSRVRYRPPIELLDVGAVLLQDGFEVELFDTRLVDDYQNDLTERLETNDYLFILLTTVLEVGSALQKSAEMQTLCKAKAPNTPVIWDNYFSSTLPDYVLKKFAPDYIVRFERIDTMRELATALLRGDKAIKTKGDFT